MRAREPGVRRGHPGHAPVLAGEGRLVRELLPGALPSEAGGREVLEEDPADARLRARGAQVAEAPWSVAEWAVAL